MNPLTRLLARYLLRLVTLGLIYIGVTEADALTFVRDPEVVALATLAVSELFFTAEKGWQWAKGRWGA